MPEPIKPKPRIVYTACKYEPTDGYAFPRYVMAVPDPILTNELHDEWIKKVADAPYNIDTRACYIKIGVVRG